MATPIETGAEALAYQSYMSSRPTPPTFCDESREVIRFIAQQHRGDIARVIWETSRADEGTISVTGANVVADAVLAYLTREA